MDNVTSPPLFYGSPPPLPDAFASIVPIQAQLSSHSNVALEPLSTSFNPFETGASRDISYLDDDQVRVNMLSMPHFSFNEAFFRITGRSTCKYYRSISCDYPTSPRTSSSYMCYRRLGNCRECILESCHRALACSMSRVHELD